MLDIGIEEKDIPRGNIDKISYLAVPIKLFYDETELSLGSAFFYAFNEKTYLITNWHNVTGINPITKQHLSDNLAEPNVLNYVMLEHKRPYIKRKRYNRKLYFDKEMSQPSWLIHPKYGKSVDVVALEVSNKDNLDIPYINQYEFDKFETKVADDVFILGFPYAIHGGGNFPIRKRGTIATEPDLDLDNLPKILVDTASKSGMSGAPVIYRRTGLHNIGSNGELLNDSIIGTIEGFVGIYSGRIIGKSDLDAQLGIVRKANVIEEIVKGQVYDSKDNFLK